MDENIARKMISTRLHNENYEQIIFDEESYGIYQSFMAVQKKRSDNTYNSTKSNLRSLFKLFDKRLRDLKRSDLIYYLNVLNSRDIGYSSKEAIRKSLEAFFKFVKRKLNLAGVKYINPLPKFFLFTKDPVKTLRERIEETEMKYYTIDELKQIVRHSIDTPFEIRISILIQMFTGCRISELVTIHVDDIAIAQGTVPVLPY